MQAAALRAFLWVNLACLCWAGNLVVGRLLRDDIPPSLLVALRTLVAAALLWMLLRYVDRSRASDATARGPVPWGMAVLMAATGIAGYQGLLYAGLHTTGAFNAALINALCPLMTALMAWAVLGTGISPRAGFGIVLSIVGVLVIMSAGEPQRLTLLRFQRGDVLILVAVLLWGVYSLAARRVMQTRPVLHTTALATGLAIPISLFWVLLDRSWSEVEWSGGAVAGLAYVAVFASVVAMLSWNRAVQLAGPAQAAAAMNMMPVYALAVSVTVLNEPLQFYQFVGGVIVIAGCLLGTLSAAQARKGAQATNAPSSSGTPAR